MSNRYCCWDFPESWSIWTPPLSTKLHDSEVDNSRQRAGNRTAMEKMIFRKKDVCFRVTCVRDRLMTTKLKKWQKGVAQEVGKWIWRKRKRTRSGMSTTYLPGRESLDARADGPSAPIKELQRRVNFEKCQAQRLFKHFWSQNVHTPQKLDGV